MKIRFFFALMGLAISYAFPTFAQQRSLVIFRLDSFEIENTRSRHTDTDVVSFSLKVGDKLYGTKTRSMGDLNNGKYPLFMSFGPVECDNDNEPIHFNYTIINAGNN